MVSMTIQKMSKLLMINPVASIINRTSVFGSISFLVHVSNGKKPFSLLLKILKAYNSILKSPSKRPNVTTNSFWATSTPNLF